MQMLLPISLNPGIQPLDTEVQEVTFSSLSLKESDVEEYIRRNVGDILEDETLLIIGQQVRNQENGRNDLVAIDENGSIVLLEIKRDMEDMKGRKEPLELQSIRYAASFAKIKTPEELVERVFAPYIERHAEEFEMGNLNAHEYALRQLLEFLSHNNAERMFNEKQRIMLFASDYDKQTLSAAAWLVNSGVDMSVFRLNPLKVEQFMFLSVEKVLPLEQIENFYVEIAERSVKAKYGGASNSKDGKRTQRTLPRMGKLFEWGVLGAGDELYIKGYEGSTVTVLNEKEVEYNGRTCRFNEWGCEVTGWSTICIYDFAVLKREEKTLGVLRQQRMEEEGL